jgi:tRNA(His) 5'-end guanylyltransferase
MKIMSKKGDLDTRMKEFYEGVSKTKLIRRMPVIIRIDGKTFHTFTKGFKQPYDELLRSAMEETTKYLCENIQGCVLGYTQSDEISLLLIDYATLDSSAWFDNEVQKMCSISASMATMQFNKIFAKKVDNKLIDYQASLCPLSKEDKERIEAYHKALVRAKETGAIFDSRAFNIPREEVTNYFYWRQQDATKNSIQMLARCHFTHKALQGKTCRMLQDMLFTQRGINWNNVSIKQKRGSAVVKREVFIECNNTNNKNLIKHENKTGIFRKKWKIDEYMPILSGDGRTYIEGILEEAIKGV